MYTPIRQRINDAIQRFPESLGYHFERGRFYCRRVYYIQFLHLDGSVIFLKKYTVAFREVFKFKLNDRQLTEAFNCGGTDIKEWQDYRIRDDVGYADYPDHFLRSLSHSPNHAKHSKKVLDQ